MARISLTNQATVLNNCQQFKTLARNQLLARKEFLERLGPKKLKALYKSGKDPVLNELLDIYKGLNGFFYDIREVE